MCNAIGNVSRIGLIGGCCLGLAMQFLVTFNCSFLVTEAGSNIGIWYVDDGTGNCVDWVTDDGVATGAQSALTISTIAGFAAGTMVLFEWLICAVCCAGCLEGLAFATAWMVGGAVFMIYGVSECGNVESFVDGSAFEDITNLQGDGGGCSWGTDATYMIVACAAYLICGIVFCCTPKPEPICRQ